MIKNKPMKSFFLAFIFTYAAGIFIAGSVTFFNKVIPSLQLSDIVEELEESNDRMERSIEKLQELNSPVLSPEDANNFTSLYLSYLETTSRLKIDVNNLVLSNSGRTKIINTSRVLRAPGELYSFIDKYNKTVSENFSKNMQISDFEIGSIGEIQLIGKGRSERIDQIMDTFRNDFKTHINSGTDYYILLIEEDGLQDSTTGSYLFLGFYSRRTDTMLFYTYSYPYVEPFMNGSEQGIIDFISKALEKESTNEGQTVLIVAE